MGSRPTRLRPVKMGSRRRQRSALLCARDERSNRPHLYVHEARRRNCCKPLESRFLAQKRHWAEADLNRRHTDFQSFSGTTIAGPVLLDPRLRCVQGGFGWVGVRS